MVATESQGRRLDRCEGCAKEIAPELLAEVEEPVDPYPETVLLCEECFVVNAAVCGWPRVLTAPAWVASYEAVFERAGA